MFLFIFEMVREDILGGLRIAVEKGESLFEAMMTFYGAGYSKKEIEESAEALLKEKEREQTFQNMPSSSNSENIIFSETGVSGKNPPNKSIASGVSFFKKGSKRKASEKFSYNLDSGLNAGDNPSKKIVQEASAYGEDAGGRGIKKFFRKH